MINTSEEIEAVDTSSSCASCGTAEIDDIKLKECDGCDLVKYCSDGCRMEHKSNHEEACKKRAAELRDQLLFKLPESSHLGDCPICCLPLPIDKTKSTIYECCSTLICNGCTLANNKREIQGRLGHTCLYCREPMTMTQEEDDKQRMKRIEANDPDAIRREAVTHHVKGDYRRAFEYYRKAAELGHAEAHFSLAYMHQNGEGVEEDRGKEMYHTEEAAIGGHPVARYNLGVYEFENGNIEKAVKHLIIAASQGYDDSIKVLMKAFKGGFVSKEDLAAALRAHQAAVDATKSPQRDVAEEGLLKKRLSVE